MNILMLPLHRHVCQGNDRLGSHVAVKKLWPFIMKKGPPDEAKRLN